jgi:putative oxidoreductase
MEIISQYHESVATLVVRVILGLLFFFQGYDAIFNVRVENIIDNYDDPFESKGIPKFLTVIGSWFTSYAKLIGGTLLILGLFKYVALYLLGVDLIITSMAFSIAKPMWDMRHFFPRLALLALLLIVPPQWDIYSLDRLLINL